MPSLMILCCGEALIDMLPRAMAAGELEYGGQGFLPVPGGALFNTAVALGRLGEEAGFFCPLSTDMFGEQLVDYLDQSGVDSSFCPRLENPTTLAFVKLVNGNAQYSFFDENSALRNLQNSALPELPNTTSALHFGGISLIPEPGGGAFETLMRNNQDKLLSFDPNIRTGFVQDASEYRSRISRMIAMADILKVSDEDLAWIADGKPIDELISGWLQGITKVVLLTEGAKGVTAYTSVGTTYLKAVKTSVVDTIGAGDTFNAGFLAGLRRSALLEKTRLNKIAPEALSPALELASNVASLTVAKAGANPPWANEL